MGRGRFLAGMRSRILQTRIESSRSIAQTFQSHRARDVGNGSQALPAQDGQSADGVHRLSAIEQGEAFLGGELRWFQFCALQRVRASGLFPVKKTSPSPINPSAR